MSQLTNLRAVLLATVLAVLFYITFDAFTFYVCHPVRTRKFMAQGTSIKRKDKSDGKKIYMNYRYIYTNYKHNLWLNGCYF